MLYTRPLVTPLTRPLTGKVLKQFDPLSNDPYLLFDAETSMLGELESPTLDLDASDPETLEVITATRSGVATFTDQAGVIQEAEPNTVRVDWSLGYPAMLIEPSATNLLSYSEDFTQSSWVKNDVDVSAAPVAAPDGTMTAAHVSVTGSNPHLVDLDVVQANTHTVSIWARTVSGSGTCYFNANSTGAVQTVTDQWQRFEVPANNIHAYAVDFRGSSTLTEIYIWGAQAELGSVATSYIPTSGSAVTRNTDNLVIDGTDFSDAYNQSEGTIYTEFVPRRVDYYQHLYEFHNGGNTNRINVHFENGNARFYLASGGTTYANTVAATNVTTGELHRTGFSYKTNDASASFDGGAEITDTTVTVPSGIDRVHLGWFHSLSDTYALNGHIKRLIYWPTHSSSL